MAQVLRQRRILAAGSAPERIVAEILVRKIPEDQQAIGQVISRSLGQGCIYCRRKKNAREYQKKSGVGRGYAVLWIRNKEKIGFGSGFDINFGTGSGLLMKNTLDFTLFDLKAQRILHQNLKCRLLKFLKS